MLTPAKRSLWDALLNTLITPKEMPFPNMRFECGGPDVQADEPDLAGRDAANSADDLRQK